MRKKGSRLKVKASDNSSAKTLEVKTLDGDATPYSIALATDNSRTRGVKSPTIETKNQFNNIEEGITPFKYSSLGADTNSNMDISEAVRLTQKAYYNFSIFRNTIDLMTEFSTANIFLKGGSKKSRSFFEALFNKNNLYSLEDKFFREYYRSGNVFVYRMDGKIKEEDIFRLSQVFGTIIKGSVELPMRYVILNPSELQAGGSISFSNTQYYKILSDYELERLRNPRTKEDREVFDSLDEKAKKQIAMRGIGLVLLPLDLNRTIAVFYKKQDYEPFAVPMGYPVLKDLNWKAEMKKADMIIVRTMQQVILLVTMGTEPDKGGINPKYIEAIKTFFETESIARVLVADYTTKAEFVIPDIAGLLDPKKYEVVDRDIKEGLNNLLISSEDKYANANMKIQVFIQRLKQARQAFINEFLLPEIKRIATVVGLKNYPTPYFEDIDFKDDLEYTKIYTRLMELGLLTPEEGIQAIENGRLPTSEESVESQENYRTLRDKGYYEPMVGGPYTQKSINKDTLKNQQDLADKSQEHDKKMKQAQRKHEVENPPPPPPPAIHIGTPAGRPTGTKQKQTKKKKVTPIGASDEAYSLSRLKEVIGMADNLNKVIVQKLKEDNKLESLSEQQVEFANILANSIMASEQPENWTSRVSEFLTNPPVENSDISDEIIEIAANHGVSSEHATLLYWSKINE